MTGVERAARVIRKLSFGNRRAALVHPIRIVDLCDNHLASDKEPAAKPAIDPHQNWNAGALIALGVSKSHDIARPVAIIALFDASA